MNLYVAPDGNNNWSGLLPAPNRAMTDGPLQSLDGARSRIRARKNSGRIHKPWTPHDTGRLQGPINVHLRGGVYPMAAPVAFGPEDSWPVTYQAYRNEKPVLSGAVRIRNWRETEVHGRRAWVADLPSDVGPFRQLFVNGRRAERPRMPESGFYRMQAAPGMPDITAWGPGGYTKFVCAAGDIKPWHNPSDCEIVYVHFWIEERTGIQSFDPATNLVTMARPSCAPLLGSIGKQLADYYVDNVFEALRKPGQWYLDRPAGRIYYLPRPGETPDRTEVLAPRALQLIRVVGAHDENRLVERLCFKGLTFAHTDWRHPSQDGAPEPATPGALRFSKVVSRGGNASVHQAAADVPGVLYFEGAHHCTVEDCTIEHVGWYGIDLAEGCRNVRLIGNTIRDTGAGGVRISGADARGPAHRRTGENLVTDNHIHAGGRVFHSGVGILSMHSFGNIVAHNHIHDHYFTGISCGWVWGYDESVSRDNLIAYNHIHDIGQKVLSDMGGIYTLGVQPGTVIRGNLIHDVSSVHYGGWCIYPDEGSSHMVIEDNICYDADCQPFHQHYGRENIVRNNIWVLGGESVAKYSRLEPHLEFTFERNILVTNGHPVWVSPFKVERETARMVCDLNLIWDISGKRPVFQIGGWKGRKVSLKAWQALGYDRHSVVADPRFRNLARHDFRLKPGSPAVTHLGFKPLDPRRVGPRPKSQRGTEVKEPA